MTSGLPPAAETRMIPPRPSPNTIPSLPQETPRGFPAWQIVTAAPPLTAILFNDPSAPDQKAIESPSGENTVSVTPCPLISVPGIGLASNSEILRRYSL